MHVNNALVAIRNYLCGSTNTNMHLIGIGAVEQLEKKLKEFYRVKYALCFSNATNALTTAAFALGIVETDVITTPLSYGASVSGLLHLGNRLIFSDVDKETNTLCLLPDAIEKRVTENTRAVLAVDYGGVPHNMYRLREICNTYGLKYIADASQSFGAFLINQPAGRMADVSVISFTVGKTLFAGEGAAILTDDHDLYDKIIWYSQHPYRQKKEIGLGACNEFSFINGRISPLSAILANETFEDSLERLKKKQILYLNLIHQLNQSGITKPLDFEEKNILPAFFKLYLGWLGRREKKKLANFLYQTGYGCIITPLEPIYKNQNFLLQFPGQFKCVDLNCNEIEKEFFELTLIPDNVYSNIGGYNACNL